MKWEIVAQARRILAKEQGYVLKDWGGKLPVALAYANTYRVGMSSLGLHTVYRLFNELPHVVCERVFWPGDAQADEPLITLESQQDILDCALLAFSLSFELDYFHMVSMLHQAGIPLFSQERDETYPLVLAGGPAVTANPEPLAAICDAFVIGEAEEIIEPLADLLWNNLSAKRADVLDALARLPGVYVPGRSALPVRRRWVRRLEEHPTSSVILTPDTEFGDMFLVEASRGCGHGCRFCLAGYIYRPYREQSLDNLLALARQGATYRQRIGLVGAALSDYSRIDELVEGLEQLGLSIAVSSLRAKPLSDKLLAALAAGGTRTLTLAPEAGCQRLRQTTNKGLSQEEILTAAELAQKHRFPALKLYFMIGLPGESDADVAAIVDLLRAVAERFSGALSINVSPFVPKAHTPFQWATMAPAEVLEGRLRLLSESLRPEHVEVRGESVAWSRVQGVLARGDRRLGTVLAEMRGHSSLRAWARALRRHGLTEEMFLRERAAEETLPWSVVDMGVAQTYLWTEAERARLGQTSPPCPPSPCERCGVCTS